MQNSEIYLLALLFLAFSLYTCLYLKRQLRLLPIKLTHDQIIETKFGVVMFIYFAICTTGLNFLPVERAGNSIIDGSPQLMWLAFFSALALFVLARIVVTRIKYKISIILSLFLLPIISVMNYGFLLAINGALDITSLTQYQVEVLSKQFIPGGSRSAPTHVLIARNWKYSEGPVKLTSSPAVFKATNIGDKLLVEIGAGLLGIEWVKSIQPASENQPN